MRYVITFFGRLLSTITWRLAGTSGTYCLLASIWTRLGSGRHYFDWIRITIQYEQQLQYTMDTWAVVKGVGL